MPEAIHDALGEVLSRWMMGAAAAPAAAMWKAEIGTEPGEAELRLLALSGQFLSTAILAQPPRDLQAVPDVPKLDLPTLPDPLRPLTRRLLQNPSGHRGDILHFLAGRGWTMHPDDWMPAAGDDVAPDVYDPWRDWAQAAASGEAGGGSDEDLTADNWDDHRPAARRTALAALRRRDPAAARVLLEAKVASEGADVRLRLLGVLATRLSDADMPFLQGIVASDRAPKVRLLATSLLARLGHGSAAKDDVVELAVFFELRSKGFLRRRRIVVPRSLKTDAQNIRRHALIEAADFTAFAEALGLGAAELAAAWSWGEDDHVDLAFATMAQRSASDAVVEALCDSLAENPVEHRVALFALVPRLADARRKALARHVAARHDVYEHVLAVGGPACRIDGAIDLPAGRALIGVLASDSSSQAGQLPMLALGLIASRRAAAQALDRLAAAGLLQGDPRLDMIRLNAALDDKGEQS
jgi:hypothetical protein